MIFVFSLKGIITDNICDLIVAEMLAKIKYLINRHELYTIPILIATLRHEISKQALPM